jgi:hypothetical protein
MPLSGNSEAGGMTLIGSGLIPTAGAFLNRKPRATANGAAPYLHAPAVAPRRPAVFARSSSPRAGGTVRGRGAVRPRMRPAADGTSAALSGNNAPAALPRCAAGLGGAATALLETGGGP